MLFWLHLSSPKELFLLYHNSAHHGDDELVRARSSVIKSKLPAAALQEGFSGGETCLRNDSLFSLSILNVCLPMWLKIVFIIWLRPKFSSAISLSLSFSFPMASFFKSLVIKRADWGKQVGWDSYWSCLIYCLWFDDIRNTFFNTSIKLVKSRCGSLPPTIGCPRMDLFDL